MDYQKWVNLGLLAAGAVVFLFLRQLFETVWFGLGVPAFEAWPVAPYDALAFIVASVGTLAVRKNRRANPFLGEVVQELAKVTWPNQKETVLSTGVVLIMVGVCTVVLFLIDIVWGTITRGVMAG